MKTPSIQVVLLGTGNPNPDPYHAGPSVAIIVNETPYIVDFGPGLVRQAAALTPHFGGIIPALEARNLTKAFLTHLHSDHTAGYPDLILTPWVMGRKEPLEVFGPPGTRELTDHILRAYQADIRYRLYGLEPINHRGWQVNVHEIDEGIIYSDANVKVEAFQVKHGNWQKAYGFRFSTPDKRIVISGDTAPCENIAQFSHQADILLHEVYYHEAFNRLDAEWKNYHSTHHTSTLELAEIARISQPKTLILYHTLYWGGTDEDLLQEIRTMYDGKILAGADLQVIDLGNA